jgi:hypothetical protein
MTAEAESSGMQKWGEQCKRDAMPRAGRREVRDANLPVF